MSEDSGGARTRVEATFNSIRDDIISGQLAPGSRLAVERLRPIYGVGSSTIREALSLLVADALVYSEGQRGFTVAPMSPADLRDLSRVRVVLESHALAQSIAQGDDDWEADIVAAFHRLGKAQERFDPRIQATVLEWERRNREFHDALTARCGSRWTNHMLTMLRHHSERYRRAAIVDDTVSRDVHGEHRALMEATLARQVDVACKVLAEHIEQTGELAASQLEPPDPSSAPGDSVRRAAVVDEVRRGEAGPR